MAALHSVTSGFRFRGTPNGVECLAPLHLEADRNARHHTHLFLPLPHSEISASALRVFTVSSGIFRLWFPLPPHTAPGTYEGNARIGSTDYPITVEVEAQENLVLSPSQLNVVANPGEQITAHFSLANAGNVACEMGSAHLVGLYDVEGMERAIGATFREPEAEGKDKAARLMDHLANEHGGVIRIHIEQGEGLIAPGEVRELVARLRFPDTMKPGRSYTGSWVMHNLVCQIHATGHGKKRKETQ